MHDSNTRGASTNAEGKHVHTPEDGGHPDDALAPGNTSGSGDVERAQRQDALRVSDPRTAERRPIPGGPSREPTANDPQPGLNSADTPAGTDAPPPSGARAHAPAQDTRVRTDLGVREPEGESKDQLERIQERNRELIEDDAEPGPEGERETGVGETVRSVPSQTGDYSSD